MTAQNKAEQLVMGANADPGLVAVEPLTGDAHDEMILYSRKGSKITVTKEPFRPFLWLELPGPCHCLSRGVRSRQEHAEPAVDGGRRRCRAVR